jgi:hypothetical protein
MLRPHLSPSLSAQEFSRWYWLKAELTEFCRSHQLSASGSKQEVAARIKAFLSGQEAPALPSKRKSAGSMPQEFKLTSVIGPNWRCSQNLRAFFEIHAGRNFHFNQAMRNFIASGEGRTLEEALNHYKESLDAPSTSIDEQFEYNRHMRSYHTANPGATQAEAVAAWWAKRGRPGG